VKYFGEYLVTKGICSEDQLIDALIEQSKFTPMAIEVAFKKKLIPSKDILKASQVQIEKKVDFKTACLELKLWTNEINLAIENGIHSARKPIGHILIQKGITDLPSITKAMDDFLSRKEAPSNPALAASSVSASKPTLQKTSSPGKDSAISTNIFLEEFLNYFSETKMKDVVFRLNKLANKDLTSDICLSILKDVLTEIHIIRGLTKMLKLEKIDQMNQMYEMYSIRLIDTKCTPDYFQFLPTFSQLGKELLDELKSFSKFLSENPNDQTPENSWHKNDQQAARHTSLFQKITDACLEVI
jgi:hypothetical protein